MSDDLRAILESVNGLHGKIDTHSRDTHKRIDDLGEKVSGLAIQVTRVEGEVQSYNRPCAVVVGVEKDVVEHLENHKEVKRITVANVAQAVVTVVCALVVAYVIFKRGW